MATVKPKPGLVLSSSHLVRALDLYGSRYACEDCGAKMFVRYESGLCPHCFNARRSKNTDVNEVLFDFEHDDGEERG